MQYKFISSNGGKDVFLEHICRRVVGYFSQ